MLQNARSSALLAVCKVREKLFFIARAVNARAGVCKGEEKLFYCARSKTHYWRGLQGEGSCFFPAHAVNALLAAV
jgi:hypothetical protein